VILLASLEPRRADASRGAEAQVFRRLFQTPFGGSALAELSAPLLETRAPPPEVMHGPIAGTRVESGHLEGLGFVPSAELGYRVAFDRFSVAALAGLGYGSTRSGAPLQYELRRYGVELAPRYDLPLGALGLALSAGPNLGAALEEQALDRPGIGSDGQPITIRDLRRTFSFHWGGALGLLLGIGDGLQLGVDVDAGGRVLKVGDRVVNRVTAGAGLAGYMMY
jgi:hypothetical protein